MNYQTSLLKLAGETSRRLWRGWRNSRRANRRNRLLIRQAVIETCEARAIKAQRERGNPDPFATPVYE